MDIFWKHTVGKVVFSAVFLQFWDTRQAACVLTVADNEDFISDMACDAEKRTLLATRYNGNIPGWGHCVVFLSKMLYSHNASLHPGV